MALFLSACSAPVSYSFNGYLGTFSTIVTQEEYPEIKSVLGDFFDALDESVNTETQNSEIRKFNNTSPGEMIEIAEDTYRILSKCAFLYSDTEGFFNPAIGGLIDLWGFSPRFSNDENAGFIDGREKNTLPSDEYITAFSNSTLTDFSKIVLKNENGKYYVIKPSASISIGSNTYSMQLNLGGVAKGFAADRCSEIIRKYTTNYYVSIGMSSLYLGENTKKEDLYYSVQIQHPRGADFLTVKCRNEGGSTSGDYQNYFICEGKRYCHVINPFTGRPIDNGTVSVSLFGPDATILDALSTAVMIMGKDAGTAFLKNKHPECKYIFTTEDENGLTVSTNMDKKNVLVLDENLTMKYDESN